MLVVMFSCKIGVEENVLNSNIRVDKLNDEGNSCLGNKGIASWYWHRKRYIRLNEKCTRNSRQLTTATRLCVKQHDCQASMTTTTKPACQGGHSGSKK